MNEQAKAMDDLAKAIADELMDAVLAHFNDCRTCRADRLSPCANGRALQDEIALQQAALGCR